MTYFRYLKKRKKCKFSDWEHNWWHLQSSTPTNTHTLFSLPLSMIITLIQKFTDFTLHVHVCLFTLYLHLRVFNSANSFIALCARQNRRSTATGLLVQYMYFYISYDTTDIWENLFEYQDILVC